MTVFLNKSLLITRPLRDGIVFSESLKFHRPINTICRPLFEIEILAVNKDVSKTRGIIVTSSNAVRSLKQSNVQFKGPVFCVGRSTASIAQEAGYRAINSNGDIYELLELIKASLSSGFGKLTYFRGEEITGDLARQLRDISFNVDEVICYRKVPSNLSSEIINCIENNLIIASTFFSKQTANLFSEQVKYLPNGFVAFCISEEVSRTISALYPEAHIALRIASKPSVREMCKLIVAAPEFAV